MSDIKGFVDNRLDEMCKHLRMFGSNSCIELQMITLIEFETFVLYDIKDRVAFETYVSTCQSLYNSGNRQLSGLFKDKDVEFIEAFRNVCAATRRALEEQFAK